MIEALTKTSEATAYTKTNPQATTELHTVSSDFCDEEGAQSFTKETVAKHFSAASGHYDRYAQVQKQIAQVNLDLLNNVRAGQHNAYSVDLGCGTGIHTKSLAAISDRCLAIDISIGMLEMAKSNHTEVRTASNKEILYCNADAERLPLGSESIDIIHSSMALQWCSSPNTAISEIARVLSKSGSAQLAIMLNSSLYELRQAWESLGIASRVNQFFSLQQWLQAAGQLGSAPNNENIVGQFNIEYTVTRFTEWHQSSLHMLRALKRIGAATKNTTTQTLAKDRSKSLATAVSTSIGKRELYALDLCMQQQMDAENPQRYCGSDSSSREQSLPLSYQVLFLTIHKSQD